MTQKNWKYIAITLLIVVGLQLFSQQQLITAGSNKLAPAEEENNTTVIRSPVVPPSLSFAG